MKEKRERGESQRSRKAVEKRAVGTPVSCGIKEQIQRSIRGIRGHTFVQRAKGRSTTVEKLVSSRYVHVETFYILRIGYCNLEFAPSLGVGEFALVIKLAFGSPIVRYIYI